MKNILYIFLFFFGSIAAQNTTVFEEANTLYNQKKYAEAIVKYESILETKQHSLELYFNLGNANYKLNNIAPSIYYYEKALQLKPNDKEVLNNIAYTKSMMVDAIQTIPELGLSKFFNKITHALSYDNWAKLAIVLMVLFVVLFIMYYFTYNTSKKRVSFVSSFAFLFLSLISISLAFQKNGLDKKNNPAIVFAQETEVKTDPNLASENTFVLHEGTKVQVLDTMSNWKKIRLQNGKIGWVIGDDIKLLNVF